MSRGAGNREMKLARKHVDHRRTRQRGDEARADAAGRWIFQALGRVGAALPIALTWRPGAGHDALPTNLGRPPGRGIGRTRHLTSTHPPGTGEKSLGQRSGW